MDLEAGGQTLAAETLAWFSFPDLFAPAYDRVEFCKEPIFVEPDNFMIFQWDDRDEVRIPVLPCDGMQPANQGLDQGNNESPVVVPDTR